MKSNKFQLFLISYTILCHSSFALDTLTQGQTLKDGQTLLSSQQVFELGFFAPGNSTYRYVGIWYHDVLPQTVVWVANRKIPLANSGGSLIFGSDDNLVLVNDQNDTLWSTNASNIDSNSSPSAQIMDTGEFVLLSGNETTIWDSFDHPSDTFLPGMKVSLNRKTGVRTLITSWKSPNDPSMGNYSLGLDPSGSGQLFIWKGEHPWWRSGQWDGTDFIGSTMRPLYLYGFKPVNDVSQGLMYFTYEPFNSSLLRFVMQWDGVETTSMLEETRAWESVWVQPVNECETYGHCGNYGVCDDNSNAGSSTCSCLQGFVPRFSDEWNRGNWTGGCVRRTPLNCELNSNTNRNGSSYGNKKDGFYRYQAVKVPDLSDWASLVVNEADCQKDCLKNCSCKAYAYVSGIGCLIWGRDLIDISQFPEGFGSDLYIKLAASELGSKGNVKRIIVIICASVIFFLMACILLWWKFNTFLKDSLKKKDRRQSRVASRLHSMRKITLSFLGLKAHEEEEGKDSELTLFDFDIIAEATNNFSDLNKLGEGGFGDVYKGMLQGGQEVAAKRLSRSSGQGLEEFMTEMTLIAKLQHRNLVRLLGCCIEGDEKVLIYEYLPNKSLDAFIFDPTRRPLLNWNKRFNIMEEIARGLVYLHRDSRLRIVHRDLKASNILLDEDMNPKISDFGMARIFGEDQNEINTNRVVGTLGYMSPEYAMEGIFSVKSDVYSFGILVLEIISGRRNNSFRNMPDIVNIVGYAWQLWNEDCKTKIIDETILDSCLVDQALRCIHVGLLCVQDRADDRPDMPSVILMLESDNARLPRPKQPLFTMEGSPNLTMEMTNGKEATSGNDVISTAIFER